jgi:hypothetical protein
VQIGCLLLGLLSHLQHGGNLRGVIVFLEFNARRKLSQTGKLGGLLL